MKTRHGPLATVVLVTVGILRDYHQRRWAMFYIVLAALFTAFCGSVFFMDWLRERPFLFLGYWAICGWLTMTAALLAIFDLLIVRRSGMEEKRRLRKSVLGEADAAPGRSSQEDKIDAEDP